MVSSAAGVSNQYTPPAGASNAAVVSDPGAFISQTLVTQRGSCYQLTFFLISEPTTGFVNSIQVTYAGQQLTISSTQTPTVTLPSNGVGGFGGPAYYQFTTVVTGVTSADTLGFGLVRPGGTGSDYLTGVSLVPCAKGGAPPITSWHFLSYYTASYPVARWKACKCISRDYNNFKIIINIICCHWKATEFVLPCFLFGSRKVEQLTLRVLIQTAVHMCAGGDPWFTSFDGIRYPFHGVPGQIFNIISEEHHQMNALFTAETNPKISALHGLSTGTWMTEVQLSCSGMMFPCDANLPHLFLLLIQRP